MSSLKYIENWGSVLNNNREKQITEDATEGAELKVSLNVAWYDDAPVSTNTIK